MYLMVLNDGETYTNLEGCMIVLVPDEYDMEGIEEELKAIHESSFGVVKEDGAQRIFAFPEKHRIFLRDETAKKNCKLTERETTWGDDWSGGRPE